MAVAVGVGIVGVEGDWWLPFWGVKCGLRRSGGT